MHENGRNRALPFVQPGLHHRTLGTAVRVGFQLFYFGHQVDALQQIANAHAGQRRHRHTDRVAAPLFGYQLVFRKLFLDDFGVCLRFIHLVDRHDDGSVGRLGVVD
ncbi:hypothetical protein SDC9_157682 [bioreactor metagenome]|uniref:Uncharacterized protein n=1 Tax=bioreactor metagenome TaxID=1076179 RepID=A0A645F829_9ZZZZ